VNRATFCFLIAVAIATSNCTRNEGVKTTVAVAASEPEQPITPVQLEPEFQPTEVQLKPDSGETVWAEEFFDGGSYGPYRPKVIERIQRALKVRGLYGGPVNGLLDKPTMKAIYAFQRMAGRHSADFRRPHSSNPTALGAGIAHGSKSSYFFASAI
jgi:putative peptidoglycan binding protein